jgi:hypothetical protein
MEVPSQRPKSRPRGVRIQFGDRSLDRGLTQEMMALGESLSVRRL